MAKTNTKQNDDVRSYLESIGASTESLDRLPTVDELLAQGNDPFAFEGPNYRPDLGAYSQVFTEEQVSYLRGKGYVEVPEGIRCKGVSGGRFMFCPSARAQVNADARRERVDKENRASVQADGGATYRHQSTRQVARDF